VEDASPIVLHRQMLEMLLGRGDRDNAALKLAGLHSLTKFTARMLVQ
jgi:hypothetical protein